MSDNEKSFKERSPERSQDGSSDRSRQRSRDRSPERIRDRSPQGSIDRNSDRSGDRSPKRSRDRSHDRNHDRSSNEKSPRGRKRSRSRSADSRDNDRRSKRRYNDRCELRLLIQSKDAGSIIGRGGANIKRLRQDYKAGVTISDSRAPERIVIIVGEPQSISDVLEEILKSAEEQKRDAGRRETEVEAKVLIHQSQAGCVIGKAGTKLKEIRLEAGVDMKVYSQCCPRSTERIVQVIGKPHNVTRCIANVIDILKTWPPRGMNNPYDPANYDESSVRDYGGYQDDDRGRGRDRDRGRRSSGGGGGGRDRGSLGGLSSIGGLGSLTTLLGGSRRTTQQVSIPSELAGVIIGKGGQNIRQIRMDSGAEVDLSDSSGGSNDRVITITGTPSQIQNAQYMLQMRSTRHRQQH